MAYVGTATVQGSSNATLQSILIGEAGNQGEPGMQAVANVMYNRASGQYGNFSGMSGGVVGVATAPNQFQGQVNLANATPQQLADSQTALDNAAAGQDLTGGATFYANPSGSTAGWATNLNSSNSLQIGDHYFTNNTQGIPFQPNAAGTSTGTPYADQTSDGSDGAYSYASANSTQDQANNQFSSGSNSGQDSTDPNASGSNMLGTTPGYNSAAASGSDSTDPASFDSAMGMDVPSAINAQTNQSDQQAQADTEATNKQTAANTSAATTAANTIYSSLSSLLGDTFTRVALIATGIVLLGAALYLVATEQGQAQLKKAGLTV